MRGFQAPFYWFPWSIIIFPICWPLKTCPMPWHRPAASLLRSLPGACWWGYCLWAWVKPSGTNGPQVLWSFSVFNQLSLVIWLVRLRFGRCWWFWPILKSLQGQVLAICMGCNKRQCLDCGCAGMWRGNIKLLRDPSLRWFLWIL